MKKIRFLLAFIMLMLSIGVYAQNASYNSGDRIVFNSGEYPGFAFTVLSGKELTAICTGVPNVNGDAVVPYIIVDKNNVTFKVKQIYLINYKLPNTRLILSDGIEQINGHCFTNANIRAISIPKSLKSIGAPYGLGWCANLEEIIVDPENPYFMGNDEHTLLIQKNNMMLHAASKYKVIDGSRVPLTELTIPEGVKSAIEGSITGSQFKTINLPSTFTMSNLSVCINNSYQTDLRDVNVSEDNPVYCSDEGIVYNKDKTQLVVLPKSKTTIEEVYTVPETVTSIAQYACYGCSMKTIDFNNVTTIGNHAFDNCKFDSNIPLHIGDNVETIGEYAFNGCTSIKTMTMSESVTNVGEGAFNGCTKLESLTIGKNVTDLGDGFAASCDKLTEINVEEGNPVYSSVDGIVYTADKTTLLLCPKGRTKEVLDMPDETEKIAASAFEGSNSKKIVLGQNVKSIGNKAFYRSKGVDGMYIGPSVVYIGELAFAYSSMQSVVIGNKVDHINVGAFMSCNLSSITFEDTSSLRIIQREAFAYSKLTSITLPKSLVELGSNAFLGSSLLKTVYFEDGSLLSNVAIQPFLGTAVEYIDFGESAPGRRLGLSPTYGDAFKNLTTLRTVKLPSSLATIGKNAFDGCVNLETVEFRETDGDVYIDAFAFRNTAIKSIKFPQKLRRIGNGAFNNCNGLTDVYIPAATDQIYHQAFIMCDNLVNISVDKDNRVYTTSDGMLLNKSQTRLLTFPGGKANDKFTLLSPSIEEIADSAFFSCSNLKNITIPKKVKRIGNFAFQNCDNLSHINFLTDGLVEKFEADVEKNDANSDPNKHDHRFGNATVSAKDFVKNLTITVRKNGNEDQYDESNYWKDCAKVYSFIDEDGINEYLPTGLGDALLLASNSTKHSTVIPATVSDGENTYKVSVGDYAFEDIDPAVKEIIFEGPVDYMGACAFKDFETQTTNIENVILTTSSNLGVHELSTNRFNLPAEKYQTIFSSGQQHIYVPRSVEGTFKEDWASHADNITYKIPFNAVTGAMPTAYHGSFSREFAVDLSNGGENKIVDGDLDEQEGLFAFVPMRRYKDAYGNYLIRMQSINEGEENDGTYIPANTGVLLRKFGDNLPEYYEIAENQTKKDELDMIKSITVDKGIIPASVDPDVADGGFFNYYVGKNDGLAHKVTTNTNIGVHKAYLHIPLEAGAAPSKVSFTYNIPDGYEDVTEIDDVEFAPASSAVYNLQGQRVTSAKHGLYVVNGKKVLVK